MRKLVKVAIEATMLLIVPTVVVADSYKPSVVDIVEVETTPVVNYCTADCSTVEKVFTNEEISISCQVLYCNDELCQLVPSSVSNCKIVQ